MSSVRIHFQLVPDADGYPPVAVETLWAQPIASDASNVAPAYTLLNTPFFVRTATLGDAVTASERDGALWYESTIAHSGNSLLRLVFFDEGSIPRVSATLEELGCVVEYLPDYRLLAVNVPARIALETVQSYVHQEADAGRLDYEEPLLMASGKTDA